MVQRRGKRRPWTPIAGEAAVGEHGGDCLIHDGDDAIGSSAHLPAPLPGSLSRGWDAGSSVCLGVAGVGGGGVALWRSGGRGGVAAWRCGVAWRRGGLAAWRRGCGVAWRRGGLAAGAAWRCGVTWRRGWCCGVAASLRGPGVACPVPWLHHRFAGRCASGERWALLPGASRSAGLNRPARRLPR